jgi:tetratricopeptide (TPR) repeat protein
MNACKNKASPSSARKRRWLLVAGVLLVAAIPGVGTWYALAPPLPAISLTDADPAVVQAVEAARRDVRWSPWSDAARGRLGMVLLAHSLEDEAALVFAQAEKLNPREPRWPYLAAACRGGDPAARLDCLRRAVERTGTRPDAPLLALADALLEQGQGEEAERCYRRLLAVWPAHPPAHLGLARIETARDRLADALAHLEPCLASPTSRKAAHTLRAEIHQRRGEEEAAARDRLRAAELPDDLSWPDPWREAAMALQVGRQFRLRRLEALRKEGRREEYERLAGQLEKDYPDLFWLIEGRLRLQAGKLAEAEQALRESIRLEPAGVEARFDLGTLLARRGDHAGAAGCFRKVLELEPDCGPACLELGRCAAAGGDRAEALKQLRRAVHLMPHKAEAHRELAERLLQEGQADEARTHLRHALRANPEDARTRRLLEEANRKAGRPPP